MTPQVELFPMRASASRSAQHTILVVDDEEPSRLYMARVLADEGYRVITSMDGFQALALLERMGPGVQLVISDIMMPRMSGIELRVRLAEHLSLPPVLFVSGGHSLTKIPGPVLWKPFQAGELTAVVHALLQSGSGVSRSFNAVSAR